MMSRIPTREYVLPDQQEDFSLAVFGANDGLWDWDVRTNTVAYSARWKAMLGYDEGEIANSFEEWRSRIHPDDEAAVLASLSDFLDGTEAPYELEHRLRHRDGTYRWMLARGMALRDNHGRPYRMAGSITDITTRKEAEERLRESEALYRALVTTSPDSIILVALDGVILMANQRAAELYAYPSTDDMLGLTVFDLVTSGDRERIRAGFARVIEEGCARDQEYLLQRSDGSTFPAEISASIIRDADGQPRAMVSLARDVSERKRAEKWLRERDEQYRGIFEATSDGIIINDAQGYVVEANPAACAMHGFRREDFLGLHRTAYVHPKYHEALPRYTETIDAHGAIHVRGVNIRRDGGAFPVDIHGTSFLYKGKPHILALVRDITEQVKAEELLEKRVSERTRELSTLLEVSRQVGSTLRLEPLLGLILDQLREVVEYQGGSLLKLKDEELVVVEYRGETPREEVLGLRFPLAQIQPIWEQIAQGKPVIIANVRGDDPLAEAFRAGVGPLIDGILGYIHSWMGVPLVQKGKTIGLLSLSSDEPGFYSVDRAGMALAIASQAGVAMENARLYAQAQEAAVLEERSRLARELHDSITQALFSMTMHAEAAQMALARDASGANPTERVERNLRQLGELTEGALAEMRALIFELRPGALREEGLGAALRKHAAALSAREGLPLEVHAPEQRVPLDPGTEEHLYRCAQEALHNVIKHAGAGRAIVRLELHGAEGLILEIEDDGCGFDSASVPAGHLGLRTMADRVAQIGGTLEILPAPHTAGGGTVVRVVAPCAQCDGASPAGDG